MALSCLTTPMSQPQSGKVSSDDLSLTDMVCPYLLFKGSSVPERKCTENTTVEYMTMDQTTGKEKPAGAGGLFGRPDDLHKGLDNNRNGLIMNTNGACVKQGGC